MTARLSRALPPVVAGVGLLVLWELFVVVRHIQPFLLPKPSAIWGQFHGNATQMLKAGRVTGSNALIGLLLGVALGLAAALLASRFSVVSELITPLAIAVAAMPIIVLVAIFNNLFSITSEIPRRLMVAVVTFFIVFVNVSKGLTQSDATQLELMRSYGAAPSLVLRKVQVPNALAFLFTALKQVAPLAVITSLVAEYFGGPLNGLGSRISQAIAGSRDAVGWAYVLTSCLLGLLFYALSVALESVSMPWVRHRSDH